MEAEHHGSADQAAEALSPVVLEGHTAFDPLAWPEPSADAASSPEKSGRGRFKYGGGSGSSAVSAQRPRQPVLDVGMRAPPQFPSDQYPPTGEAHPLLGPAAAAADHPSPGGGP